MTDKFLYTDAAGEPLYRVVRIDKPDGGKVFVQEHLDTDGEWRKGLNGTPYTLYGLPYVIASEEVWLVEGEKCADALLALNITATTKSGGAGRGWTESETESLRGKNVIISPDNDEVGRKYCSNAVDALHGIAASIRVVTLPGLGEGEDVFDWLERGGDPEDLRFMGWSAPLVTPADIVRPPKPEPVHHDNLDPIDASVTARDIRACLDVITVTSRDEAVAVMLAVKHAGGTVDDFAAWRMRQTIGKGMPNVAKIRDAWKTAKPGGKANMGKLVALAKLSDRDFLTPSYREELEWRAKERELGGLGPETIDGGSSDKSDASDKSDGEAETKAATATVAISSPWDEPPENIPPRDWIIRGLMIRRHLSILVAPGGSGKSLLSAQWAIALCLGMTWGGWAPVKPEKVMLINAEDDGDEMRRRIHASCRVMGVNYRELKGRLFLADDPSSIVVAKTQKDKSVIATPLADAIIRTIEDNGIGVIVVDPFAETFEGDENSNSEVKWAAAIWRKVARETRSSVMLVHHTPKYAKGMAGDADAARGAGALVNSARIVSTLFGMTEEEAKLFHLQPDQIFNYVRFDDAKANLTLRTGKAKWFQKVSIDLSNGDSVGVLKPWSPPGVFDGVSGETIRNVLRILDAGRDGGKFLYNHKAGPELTPNWAGHVIMDALGCERSVATAIIAKWIESGLLKTSNYTSENRHPKVGVRVDFTKQPGTES